MLVNSPPQSGASPAPYATDTYDIPAVISCSPRARGNSDHSAETFSAGIHRAGGRCQLYYLRHFNIHPCMGCLRCSHAPHGHCFLTDLDQSAPLFQVLLSTPLLYIASPIYFYHLPAHFKSWIDRSQSYYLRREKGDRILLDLPPRPAIVSLQAGRRQGKKLFDGAMLTLKYFLLTFNFQVQDQFAFRGMDGADDLRTNQQACEALTRTGVQAWNQVGPLSLEDQ